jgi:Holliday junction resolvase RusA-like endonuclease
MVKNQKMQAKKVTTIPIHPSTHVRSTQGDRWLFAVSDEYLQAYDEKKLTDTGKMGGNTRRKAQLEKYNAYKQELRLISSRMGFQMPLGHFAIWFYIPFPNSWIPRKSKCRQMDGQPHTSTPDLDNLLKAFFDGIMPRKNKTKNEKGSDDRKIHCYAAFKVWCQQDQARIVISEYEEKDFNRSFILT